jgi:hypothetical protein
VIEIFQPVEDLLYKQYVSRYSDFQSAIDVMASLGKSLIIDIPVNLAGATIDCKGVGLVWLSEGNLISNGVVNINGCHITAGRFKIFDDDVTLFGTPELTPVEDFEPATKIYVDSQFVDNSSNETIDGIKTFSESPIVPEPTTDYQSVPLRSSNITVDVGSGQTYTTINQALEYLSGFYPMYKNSGVTATINLKAGFVMQEQVLVRGLNLGWITITGEDIETIIDNTSLTVDFTATDYGLSSYPAFGVSKGGTLPRIGQLFRFDVAGVGGYKHGVMAVGSGSSADITVGNGVKDAGTHGIYAIYASAINAESANASGAGTYGIFAYRSSTINAESANASGVGIRGIVAYRSSTINANSADATGAGTSGIFANNSSIISANSADVSGAGTHGIFASQGSTINAESANASGAGTYGIFAEYSSTINASSADATGAGSHGIVASRSSIINATSANVSSAGTYGIFAHQGSTINAELADASGAGAYGIIASQSSTINAESANASGAGNFGIVATHGSTINAVSATGTLNQTANTLTNNGIIYQ